MYIRKIRRCILVVNKPLFTPRFFQVALCVCDIQYKVEVSEYLPHI